MLVETTVASFSHASVHILLHVYILSINRIHYYSDVCWQAGLTKTHQSELKRMKEAHSQSMDQNKLWQQVGQ